MSSKPENKTIKLSYKIETTGKVRILQDGESLMLVNSIEEYEDISNKLKQKYRRFNVLIEKPD